MSQQGIITDNSSPEPDIETITGNSGGAVGPDGSFNINLIGDGSLVTVTGDPPTNTLTISVSDSFAILYTADSGTASPSSNNLNVFGDATQGLSTSGSGATLTFTNSDATTSQKGVLETSTDAESIAGTSTAVAVTPESLKAKLGLQTAFGMAYGNGDSSALGWTGAGTDGQVVIAATGSDPAFASLTSTGGTIIITAGSNSLNLEADVDSDLMFTTDSGTATASGNNINILGSGGITTSATGSTVTIIGTSEQVVPITLLDDGDSTYTVLTSDYYLSCDVSMGVLVLDLPDAPDTGSVWIVKDSTGSSNTNNITVTTVGGVVTIDGDTSRVISTDFASLQFIFNGSAYEVF